MRKKLTTLFFDNSRIILLVFLIIFTAIIATFSTYQKKNINKFNDLISNTYLKKTLREIVNNLEPKYKIYNHRIKSGETFDKILNGYSIEKEQIKAIKENLSKKTDINKLNTNQRIQITVDQTNNKIKEFIFQISNTEKIILSKTNEISKFNEEVLVLKLNKKINDFIGFFLIFYRC